jgi:hypothetical protein
MGRLNDARRAIAVAAIAGAATLALAGCENALLAYLFKNILYQGWKVASWSAPAPVVAGETHEQGTAKRNGFPMNMAMGSNGKLHLVGWRVSAFQWISTSMEPGAASFDQAYKLVDTTPNPDSLTLMPGIDLLSNDVPIIAYGVDGTGTDHYLYYTDYNPVSGTWSGAQEIESNTIDHKYGPTFVYFLSSDFETHLWYLSEGTIYHRTTDTGPAAAWLTDVGWVAAVRLAADDVAFMYSDAARTHLLYRTWKGAGPTTIWVAPADIGIGEMVITTDSTGAAHVCFGTYQPDDLTNTARYTLRYLSNTTGTWVERDSIDGNATAGPTAWMFPPSIDVAPDRYGNEHLHMAFVSWTPSVDFSVCYTYHDESGWHEPRDLDTVHTNSFWTFPLIAVDPAGTVHVVYAWTQTELDRTMMYVRGTPGEPQNQ